MLRPTRANVTMHVSTAAEFEHPKGLIELMEQSAEEERARVVDTSAAEAATIRTEAKEIAVRRREQALRLMTGELETDIQRARERAEAEAYMVELTAKDRITDEILTTVKQKLSGLAASDKFTPVLEALLDELLPEAPEDGVLLGPVGSVEQLQQWLADRGRTDLRVEGNKQLHDGVAVQDAARTHRVTNTLSARLTRQAGALRKLCQDRLQPEGRQA